MPKCGKKDYQEFEDAGFPIRVSGAKHVEFSDEVDLSRIWHEELEIKYFVSGTSTILVDTVPITAAAGDIVVINPYEYHTNINVGNADGEYYLFMIGLDFLSSEHMDRLDIRRLLLGERIRFKNLISGNSAAASVLMQIAEEMKNKKEKYGLAVRGLVTQLFAILLRSEVECVISGEMLNDNIRFYRSIEPALSIIRTDYMSDISVESLADACKMSKFYFCRIFKRVTGLTAIQYLTEYRLGAVDVLLENSDLNIAQIAHRAGFEDESYFSRCYKKSRGISPKEKRTKLL